MKKIKTDGNRMLSIELRLKDDAKYHAVINSIRRYRAVVRQMFAAVFAAQSAGATLEVHNEYFRVKPDNANSKKILESVFDKTGKAPCYEMRNWILETNPSWLSFVWDSARATTWERWTARDPELAAQRGYLALNGVRRLAECNRIGIQFPQATARPKLDGHSLLLKWDHEIDTTEFTIPSLDGGRYVVLNRIQDGTYGVGTVTLQERDGKFRALIPYTVPITSSDMPADAVLEVKFGDDAIVLTHGQSMDSMSLTDATAQLRQLFELRSRYEDRRRANGNPRRPWGSRRGFQATQERVGRVTQRREDVVKNWNHLWTRRIVERAKSWRCGTVKLSETPDKLAGHQWKFAEMKKYLSYKCSVIGVALVTM